jgi:DNA-binding LacI/PurR family transcriptional regulator
MKPIRILPASAQVAAHLMAELKCGSWSGGMPGVNRLATELGVNRKTVVAALQQLEREGVLSNEGRGRQRRIVPPASTTVRPMRIAILDYDPAARNESYMVALQHLLLEAGHTAFFCEETLLDVGADLSRLSRLVKRTGADAWIIGAGSRAVLEWFSTQPVPAFAIFGRREGLPIAATGPDIHSAMITATRHLLALGHRRLVILCRAERRKPGPGRMEQAVLDELAARGVSTGDFNLPDWEESPAGLQKLLNSLFRVTPPTAMIIEEAPLFFAVHQFLANRGIRVPQHVSLICTDADPAFTWCSPPISHIRWNPGPVIQRVVRWAARVRAGHRDIRQTLTPAEFVPGGTIGHVPG